MLIMGRSLTSESESGLKQSRDRDVSRVSQVGIKINI